MSKSVYVDPSLCIIFTYAPAGLGHLRVTDALRHGLPEGSAPILLPQTSASISWIHRLTSRNPLGKRLMEWAQYGTAEEIVTRVYRAILARDAVSLEEEIIKVLKQRVSLPKDVLVVASHFGLAHQLAIVRSTIEERAKVRLHLIMQVTDDSPQKIWYVPNIDLITVPSRLTQLALRDYGIKNHLGPSRIEVLPYPLSPHLGEQLLPRAMEHRKRQSQHRDTTPINVSIPISGAGVGTMYSGALMKNLHRANERYQFHITVKKAYFTAGFIQAFRRADYVTISASHSDREIVELYEQLFDRVVVLLEVTKPSEQAFKSLFTPKQAGGVILLFTQPVGRQEYDNIHFLRRHGLIPTQMEQATLFELASKHHALSGDQARWLRTVATRWRGLQLPPDPAQAAKFICWCQREQVYSQMLQYTIQRKMDLAEITDTGVRQFWEMIERTVLKRPQSS